MGKEKDEERMGQGMGRKGVGGEREGIGVWKEWISR